ncbi:tlde1 domain-containing protein [Methylobacterium sp. JK268]
MGGVQMVLEGPSSARVAAPGRRAAALAAAIVAAASLAVPATRPHEEAPPPAAIVAAAPEVLDPAGPDPIEPARTADTAPPSTETPDLPLLAGAPLPAWQTAFLDPLLRAALAPPTDPDAAPAEGAQAENAPPAADAPRLPEAVPLPVPRPPDLLRPRAPRLADRPGRRAARVAQAPAAPAEDNRNFFEKLFGLPASPSAGPGLAYAALETTPAPPPTRRLIVPMPGPDVARATAVYDISARTVTLPNGERLEAHSGLGDKLDDPRFVHVPMRGATPPGTYDLTERETLFHGVRAIRLTPVGGNGAVYGRVGLLAHTFMLGPTGASNGCVSFRNYDRFLQAFLRGEVQRLVVVAGRGQDAPPTSAERRIGLSDRAGTGGGA